MFFGGMNTYCRDTHAHEECCHLPSGSRWGVDESLQELDFHKSLAGAAQANDLPRIRELLNRGAPVDGDDPSGYAPLHYAARNGHLDACLLLLQNGAQVDKCTRAGRATSLHRAAYAGHIEVVKALIQAGANIEAKDSDGCTPLHKADAQGHADIVKLLVDPVPNGSRPCAR